MNLNLLKEEWFWTAVGAGAACLAALTGVMTLFVLWAQGRAARDAILADLSPPWFQSGEWSSVRLREQDKSRWGITEVRPRGRSIRLHDATFKYDTAAGLASIDKLGPAIKKYSGKPISEYYFAVRDKAGNATRGELIVTVSSLSRPALATTFRYEA